MSSTIKIQLSVMVYYIFFCIKRTSSFH